MGRITPDSIIDMVCWLTLEQREAVLLCYMQGCGKMIAADIMKTSRRNLRRVLKNTKIRLALMICSKQKRNSRLYYYIIVMLLPAYLWHAANTIHMTDESVSKNLAAVKNKLEVFQI